MARQAIKSYAIHPAHTNDLHAIDRARSNRLKIVSVCGGYKPEGHLIMLIVTTQPLKTYIYSNQNKYQR